MIKFTIDHFTSGEGMMLGRTPTPAGNRTPLF